MAACRLRSAKSSIGLRRENRQLKLEREILSKAAAWFAQCSVALPVALFAYRLQRKLLVLDRLTVSADSEVEGCSLSFGSP